MAYTLTLSAQALPDQAGGTPATARSLGSLGSTAQKVTDWVGGANRADWYQFTLAGLSTLDLRLSGLANMANVTLYDGTGTRSLASDSGSAGGDGSLIRTLAAGTYYVAVTPYSSSSYDTAYTLTLSAQALADQASNTVATARALGALGSTAQTITDWVGATDDPTMS